MCLTDELSKLIDTHGLTSVLSELRDVVQEEAGKQDDDELVTALELVAEDLDAASTDAETGGL